jgi:hypothetical protein
VKRLTQDCDQIPIAALNMSAIHSNIQKPHVQVTILNSYSDFLSIDFFKQPQQLFANKKSLLQQVWAILPSRRSANSGVINRKCSDFPSPYQRSDTMIKCAEHEESNVHAEMEELNCRITIHRMYMIYSSFTVMRKSELKRKLGKN